MGAVLRISPLVWRKRPGVGLGEYFSRSASPVAHAKLGVFVDPCLRNGFREARKARPHATSPHATPPPTTLELTLDYGSQNTSVRGVASLPYTPAGGPPEDPGSSYSTTAISSQGADETKQKDRDLDLEMALSGACDGTQVRRRSYGERVTRVQAEGGGTGLGIRLGPLSPQDYSLDEAEELYNQVESQL